MAREPEQDFQPMCHNCTATVKAGAGDRPSEEKAGEPRSTGMVSGGAPTFTRKAQKEKA